MTQPQRTRQDGNDFLSTYMSYYVCYGAVIAPEFGDTPADAEAKRALTLLFPGRRIVQPNIDALAAGSRVDRDAVGIVVHVLAGDLDRRPVGDVEQVDITGFGCDVQPMMCRVDGHNVGSCADGDNCSQGVGG